MARQQQRVALARVFYQQPRLIVADDPLAAVDAHIGRQVFSALQAYASAEDGRAVILAMNQPHLLPGCSEIVHVEEGKVVAQGSFDAVVASSKSFAKMATATTSSLSTASTEQEEEDAEPLGTEAVELLPPSSEADGSDLGADAKLEDESRTTGRVQGSVIRKYLRSFGHGLFGGSCVITLLAWARMGFVRWRCFLDLSHCPSR